MGGELRPEDLDHRSADAVPVSHVPETVFFSGDMIWKVDEPASFALIVKEGAVMFEGYFDNMPFRTGAFLGDVAVMGGSEGVIKRRQTSLVALEDTEAYIING